MQLLIVCAQCKRKYQTTYADIVAGTWQKCPDCRKKDEAADGSS